MASSCTKLLLWNLDCEHGLQVRANGGIKL
jgi:hypothetical protein